MDADAYTDILRRIVEWLLDGEPGMSSKAMCKAALGMDPRDKYGFLNYPHDPGDLRRCVLLLRRVPALRGAAFSVLRHVGGAWPRLVAHWDELVALLDAELGQDLGGYEAHQTYALMRRLIEEA